MGNQFFIKIDKHTIQIAFIQKEFTRRSLQRHLLFIRLFQVGSKIYSKLESVC